MYFWILIIIGIAVAGFMYIRTLRREKPTKLWVAKANTLEDAQLAEIEPPPEKYMDMARGAYFARQRYKRALWLVEAQQKEAKKLDAARQEEDTQTQYELLKVIDSRFLSDEQVDVYIPLADKVTARLANQLIAQARRGSRSAFQKLDQMRERKPDDKRKHVDMSHVYLKVIPEDWDELVARLIKNPRLSDFAFVNKDVAPNDVLYMTVEALRVRSLRQAKIVLAFCRKRNRYRNEIGDVLFVDLAKMIDAIHSESSLFQDSSTVTQDVM